MKKYLIMIGVVVLALSMAFAVTACKSKESSTEEEPVQEEEQETQEEAPAVDGTKYGYSGDNAAELEVYKYLVDEIGKNYDKADASIPAAIFVKTDEADPEDVKVSGAFWIYNYKIDGDTLKMVSGGAHPGCLHLKKNDDGTYEVKSFDAVEDGSNYEPSAKKIFGDDYEKFSEVSSDDKAQDDCGKEAVETYVKANGLEVTQYQDEGWPAVKLDI